jgi:hypothetical protein
LGQYSFKVLRVWRGRERTLGLGKNNQVKDIGTILKPINNFIDNVGNILNIDIESSHK